MKLPTPPADDHTGPYETERQARTAAHAVVPPEPGWSILHANQNRLLLERACNAADVGLGAYDRRILDWISGFEDSTCSVIAGLITRAAGKGSEIAPTPDGRLAEVRGVLAAFDWERDDRQFALERIDRIVNGGAA